MSVCTYRRSEAPQDSLCPTERPVQISLYQSSLSLDLFFDSLSAHPTVCEWRGVDWVDRSTTWFRRCTESLEGYWWLVTDSFLFQALISPALVKVKTLQHQLSDYYMSMKWVKAHFKPPQTHYDGNQHSLMTHHGHLTSLAHQSALKHIKS